MNKVHLPSDSSSPAIAVQFLEVEDDVAGQRVDNFLLSRLKGVPKSLIYKILRKGEVRVNKGRIKPEYKLKAGDIVRVPPLRVSQKGEELKLGNSLAKRLDAAVLYEDDGLLVINKPSGLAVHGGSGVQLGLIESLRQLRDDRFLELVHRLDRGTSGCVMVAKSRGSLRHMQEALREGGVDKTYQALVTGRWPTRRQQVRVALRKNLLPTGERIVKAVDEDTEGAKASLTHYRILKRYHGCTLLEAKPVTGRTHQIRVHCQYVGHAILGDDKYADHQQDDFLREIGLKRLFLHAAQLRFTTVNGHPVSVEAPLNDELLGVLKNLSAE